MTEQKTPLEALEATIADFKATPAMRTTVLLAADASGREVSIYCPAATCFCAVGRYAYHRGEAALPHTSYDAPFKLVEDDGLALEAMDIWGPNDDDETRTGETIIPVLEGIRDRLKATLEASAA